MPYALKRVDLLLIDRRCYTFEAYAAKQVISCFEAEGITCPTIYLNDGIFQDYLAHIENSPPTWTLSFSNLTPHQTPICDVFQIPHFFWLEGSFTQAIHYLQASYGKVGLSDAHFCSKLSAKNMVYLPHGVEKSFNNDEKCFDAVLFADLIDLPLLEITWKEIFSAEEVNIIKKAIQSGDPLEAKLYFLYVEQYLQALKTNQTVNAFKNVPIDLFGEHAGNNWLVRLPKNVHLHGQLPFTEHFEVLKLSKMAILEPESSWYLPAIAAGCLPLPADESRVKYYLDHPEERERSLEKLQEKVLEQSWAKQTQRLMEYMR